VDATADQVIDALIVLEEIACELATARLDDRGLEQLRQAVADARSTARPSPRAFHALLASLTRNPALELFIDVLNRVLVLYQPDWRKLSSLDGMGKAYAAIGQAIIDHDAALARRRVRKHLEAARTLVAATARTLPRSAPFRSSGDSKLSAEVARAIANTVVRRSLEPGDLIGGEEELIGERQVSRDVFREAVRLLEYHRVAEMRRGHGGGLFVLAPSVVPVADITALYLAWAGFELDDLSELRTEVEAATAMLAAERVSAAGRARLREALEGEAAAADVPTADTLSDVHAAIAAIAGNPVLELVALVLIRVNRVYGLDRAPKRVRDKILAEVRRAHTGIAAAVDSGDRAMARSRMRTHLEAVGVVLRAG
jgi:DNA-binding FadR family transcriptional regulator